MWDYRLFQYSNGSFGIHETFYENDMPVTWTEQPDGISGETFEEVQESFKMMQEALTKPVLSYNGNPPAPLANEAALVSILTLLDSEEVSIIKLATIALHALKPALSPEEAELEIINRIRNRKQIGL